MQYEHVGGSEASKADKMNQSDFSESGQAVPKMPRPQQSFKVKGQMYRPYSTNPTAFFHTHACVAYHMPQLWIGLYMHTQSITLQENQEWQLEEPDPLFYQFLSFEYIRVKKKKRI